MKTTTENEQMTNACEKSSGVFHRWKVWRWAEPLYTSLPIPELETGRFLPCAYGSVIFKCAACGVTHWEDIVLDIDYTQTYEHKMQEEASTEECAAYWSALEE